MIGGAAEGCRGHGPAHLLVESAAEVGFEWDPCVLGWERPGLPVLSNLAGSIQHFRTAGFGSLEEKGFRGPVYKEGLSGDPPFWISRAPRSS